MSKSKRKRKLIYESKMDTGAIDEGEKPQSAGEIARNARLRNIESVDTSFKKEDGGGEGGEATVFTSTDVYTPTYGSNKKRKHSEGPKKIDNFLNGGTPKIFSKELNKLNEFIEKTHNNNHALTDTSEPLNNPKRIDWKKKEDETEHSVAHNNLPEGQFYKGYGVRVDPDPPPQYVERSKNSKEKEKWSDYTLAHQADVEEKIRGYDKDVSKSDGYGQAGQNDSLRRTDDKDRIPRGVNTNNEDDEEEDRNWWVVEKEDSGTQFIDGFFQKCVTTYENKFIVKTEIDDVS